MKQLFIVIIITICSFTSYAFADKNEVIQQKVLEQTSKGAVVLIGQYKTGETYIAGCADCKNNIEMHLDNRFHIASLTKMFTAVLIYQLIDAGQLKLNDKLIDIIGDPFDVKLDNFHHTTIEMALEHSSGMPDFIGNGFEQAAIAKRNHSWTSYEAVSYALNISATHKAGTQHVYNSTAYVLLGEVIKKLYANDDLNNIYNAQIFLKAGLNDTYFPGSKRPRHEKLARGYKGDRDVSNIEWGENLTDGGLVSTAGDLTAFFHALFEEKTLISDQSLDLMMGITNPLPLISEGGRGLMVINRHNTNYPLLYGHFGRYLGYRSAAFYNPETKENIIILGNSEDFSAHQLIQDLGLLAPLN